MLEKSSFQCIYVFMSMESNTLIERNIDETDTLYRNYFIKKKYLCEFCKNFSQKDRFICKKKYHGNLSHKFFEIL